MSMLRIALISLLTIGFLAGCSTLPTVQKEPQNQTVPWENRVQTLSTIKNWDLKGLIAVRSHARNGKKDNSWSANWTWQQTRNNYSITLTGPLGSGAVVLTGAPHQVTLETSDGKQFTAASPENLLEQQIGWRIPVSNLYYWVCGLPVPSLSARKKFDVYHHLTQMQQDSWLIQYLSYTSVQNIDVPSKIYITNPELNVKIIINQWHL